MKMKCCEYGPWLVLLMQCCCTGKEDEPFRMASPGNTKRGSITVLLTSSLTCLDYSVLQIKTKIVSSHIADSKPVKQEVNGTVILPPLVFPGKSHRTFSPFFSLFIKKSWWSDPVRGLTHHFMKRRKLALEILSETNFVRNIFSKFCSKNVEVYK
jgi:hypothetical protein